MNKLLAIVLLAMPLWSCQYQNDAVPKTTSDLDMTSKVAVPERDVEPDKNPIDVAQYTGTIEWQTEDGTVFEGAVFAVSSLYKAVVTLSAKDGWTFSGVKENSFTHSCGTEVYNEENSGMVIIVFPATAPLTEEEIAVAEDAPSFRATHAHILTLNEDDIAIEDEASVDATLTAYASLSAAAQSLLEAEKALLDGLKVKIERLKPVEKLSLAVGSFVMDGLVIENEKKIYLVAPPGTSRTSLRLQLTYQDATLPALGAPRDFSSPVSYTIAKQSGGIEAYMVEVVESALPVMMIKTSNAVPVDTKEWLEDASFVLYDGAGNPTQGSVDIKLRGNSTSRFPKKPYAIKLSRRASLLGMPSHQRWNLLANWGDPTILRNETAFKIGTTLDNMAWTPRSDQTVLYLNGEYLGVYQLTEAIKINANRINVSSTISGSNPDGGYILEMDNYYKGEPFHIETVIKRIWFSCSDPDEDLGEIINEDTRTVLEKMAADVQMAEDALYSDGFMDLEKGYRKYLDVDSFVDWWIASEIAKDFETRILNGRYMYYDPGKKKYCMGPLWDHDSSFGGSVSFYGSNSTSGFMVDKDTSDWWYPGTEWWHVRLLQDPYFVGKIKERWNEIKPGLLPSLLTYIDERSSYVREAQLLDIKKWNRAIDQSAGVNSLKTWLNNRIEWLATAIDTLQ
jgi:hypothetical protein